MRAAGGSGLQAIGPQGHSLATSHGPQRAAPGRRRRLLHPTITGTTQGQVKEKGLRTRSSALFWTALKVVETLSSVVDIKQNQASQRKKRDPRTHHYLAIQRFC